MTIEPTSAPSGAGALSAEQSMAEADRILSEAGWTTTLRPPWHGRHCIPGAVGGVAPGGTPYVKAFSAFPQGEAEGFGLDPADYPDEPHEAAAWLVEHVKGLTAPPTLAPVDDQPDRERAVPPEHGEPAGQGSDQDDADGEGAERDGALAGGIDPFDASQDTDRIDADFTESAGDAYDQDLALALEGPDDAAELPALEQPDFPDFDPSDLPAQPGPIAYAASDLDALVREKLGRVSQIARELKAILQEGWTYGELSSLQNRVVRIDSGLDPDAMTIAGDFPGDAKAAARERVAVVNARFQAISERSQAMTRVDAHRDALEMALAEIGARRDYAAVQEFDPEEGWP